MVLRAGYRGKPFKHGLIWHGHRATTPFGSMMLRRLPARCMKWSPCRLGQLPRWAAVASHAAERFSPFRHHYGLALPRTYAPLSRHRKRLRGPAASQSAVTLLLRHERHYHMASCANRLHRSANTDAAIPATRVVFLHYLSGAASPVSLAQMIRCLLSLIRLRVMKLHTISFSLSRYQLAGASLISRQAMRAPLRRRLHDARAMATFTHRDAPT